MIHSTAIIEPGAKLGNNVSVGPYSYIGNDVVIGDDCIIESHVVVKGPSTIGSGNHIFQCIKIFRLFHDYDVEILPGLKSNWQILEKSREFPK